MEQKFVGTITHFFGKINVAVVKLNQPVKTKASLHIQGDITDFEQELTEMQINHVEVDKAVTGDSIGIKVNYICRKGDSVYIVT